IEPGVSRKIDYAGIAEHIKGFHVPGIVCKNLGQGFFVRSEICHVFAEESRRMQNSVTVDKTRIVIDEALAGGGELILDIESCVGARGKIWAITGSAVEPEKNPMIFPDGAQNTMLNIVQRQLLAGNFYPLLAPHFGSQWLGEINLFKRRKIFRYCLHCQGIIEI